MTNEEKVAMHFVDVWYDLSPRSCVRYYDRNGGLPQDMISALRKLDYGLYKTIQRRCGD